jgi:PIN domain nuclease of toxin-antitoxin system
VRLLLDTHVLLWWLADDLKLTRVSRAIIANPDNEVHVSSVSLWEISIKAALGRIEVELDDLEAAIARNGFRPLPIGFRHALTAGCLPAVHATRSIGYSSRKPASRSYESFLTTECLSAII